MLSKAKICVNITTDVSSLQLRVDYCLFVPAYDAFAFTMCIPGCHVNVHREVPGWPVLFCPLRSPRCFSDRMLILVKGGEFNNTG